ncbi:MAG TPA: hypothetical protein VIE44_20310 [Methylomirabilota bacterium]|jgi:hypothetical protein
MTRLGPATGLAAALLVALALRLFFVLTPHAVLDADEAIVGLMGRHVLQGEFPIFYWGQKYMGGLEPHLAALGFAVGGATPLVLKLICLAAALVLVWLTAELGRRILGPGPGVVAGLFMALPPIFLTVWSLKARGGFVETLVLGSLVLLLALRAVEATGHPRVRAALILGLVGGLAWWTNQLVVSYLVAAGILLVRGAGWAVALRLLPAVAGSFLLGALPLWLNGWLARPATRSVWELADAATATRQLQDVLVIGLPALLGPGGQWPAPAAIQALTPVLLVIYALAWLALLATRVLAWRAGPEPSPVTGAALDAVVVLPMIAVVTCALSSFGWFVSEPRYLLPLAAVAPIVIAALLATLWRSGRPGAAIALGVALLAVNLAGHLVAPWTSAREAPHSLAPALAFLQSRRIPVVATTYWIGPRLTFESGERVVAVPMRGAPDRYPPYSAVAERADRLAYVLLPGTADVGAVERKLRELGVSRERTTVGELVVLHDLRLSGLETASPGLLFEALERLPLLAARLRIAAEYEAAGQPDRAISHLEAALEPGMPPGSAGLDRLVALYRASGQPAKASALAARRAKAFTPAAPRAVSFGGIVRFLGYTLGRPTVRGGERLGLVCFWSAAHSLAGDLYVTVRLDGGTRHRPGTSAPLAGAYGPALWQAGEVVPGSQEIPIPRDLPPGRYMLEIRVWDPRASEPILRPRLEIPRAGTRWVALTEVEVQPPSS